MKPTITWIVIADGARARIVLNAGPGKGIEAVPGMAFEGDHSASGDILADKPGRSFDSVGNARHAMENPSDPHEALKEQFIRDLAGRLEKHAGSYDRLILVAPPAALGMLRKSLCPSVAAKVTAELHKDLGNTPDIEIPGHLSGIIAV